jgi:hypothetical protein
MGLGTQPMGVSHVCDLGSEFECHAEWPTCGKGKGKVRNS